MRRISSYTSAGLTFDVRDEGPLDGDPVVLLHGFPERSTSWRDVAPLLHAAGLRTLAPDQRGYSPGARPTRRRDYRMPLLAGDVAALVAEIGSPVHLVGHDWGAAVGWYLAATQPDLVRTWTAFSVPHPTAYQKALLGPQGPRSWYMALFNLPYLPERLADRPGGIFEVFLRRTGMTKAEVARFRTEIVEYGALTGGLMWYRALPLSLRDLPDLTVSVPSTMVWSDGDTAISQVGARNSEHYCTGPFSYLELVGVTHWIPTQAPQAAAQAILDRTGAGR